MGLWTWIKDRMKRTSKPIDILSLPRGYYLKCPNCKQSALRVSVLKHTINPEGMIIQYQKTKCYNCDYSNNNGVNPGITKTDVETAIKTEVCPNCHNHSFKIYNEGAYYKSDTEKNIFRHESYSCSECQISFKRTVDTNITEDDIKKAKEILRKHDLLEDYEKLEDAIIKNEICSECGGRNLLIGRERKEFICGDEGLAKPMTPYPDWMDIKYVKMIIQNKDSKEKIKEIIKKI